MRCWTHWIGVRDTWNPNTFPSGLSLPAAKMKIPDEILKHSIYLDPLEVQLIIQALEQMPSDDFTYTRHELAADLQPYTK